MDSSPGAQDNANKNIKFFFKSQISFHFSLYEIARYLLKEINAIASMSDVTVSTHPLIMIKHPSLPNGEFSQKYNIPCGKTKHKQWQRSIKDKFSMNTVEL